LQLLVTAIFNVTLSLLVTLKVTTYVAEALLLYVNNHVQVRVVGLAAPNIPLLYLSTKMTTTCARVVLTPPPPTAELCSKCFSKSNEAKQTPFYHKCALYRRELKKWLRHRQQSQNNCIKTPSLIKNSVTRGEVRL
jgi:hypothetical protein